MPFKEEDWLPSYEELTVPEIKMSAAPLRAAAHHYGKYCDHQGKEFMLCTYEEKDPRKCINEGKEVTRCGVEFFNKLKRSCGEEFNQYWECLDHASADLQYKGCRSTQAVYDKCMLDKLGMERPPLGHFSKVRVHETKRPKPKREVPLPDCHYPDLPDLETTPRPESTKYGARNMYWPFGN